MLVYACSYTVNNVSLYELCAVFNLHNIIGYTKYTDSTQLPPCPLRRVSPFICTHDYYTQEQQRRDPFQQKRHFLLVMSKNEKEELNGW